MGIFQKNLLWVFMKGFSWVVREDEYKRYKERRMSGKQYLLMVDEVGMALLGQVCKGSLQFVPVEGMNVVGNPYMQLLATPTGFKGEVKVDEPVMDQVEKPTNG
jgi:hypothetical protein